MKPKQVKFNMNTGQALYIAYMLEDLGRADLAKIVRKDDMACNERTPKNSKFTLPYDSDLLMASVKYGTNLNVPNCHPLFRATMYFITHYTP